MVVLMILFFRLGVVLLKLDNKGMTLIESLFAFLIYINIICLLISIISLSIKSDSRFNQYINKIDRMEVLSLNIEDYAQIIEMVLH